VPFEFGYRSGLYTRLTYAGYTDSIVRYNNYIKNKVVPTGCVGLLAYAWRKRR